MMSMKALTRDVYCDMNKLVPDWSSLTNRPDSVSHKTLQL